jgi:cellulose synthase (UDP-forming)
MRVREVGPDVRVSLIEPSTESADELWRPDLFMWTVKASGAVLPEPPKHQREKFGYTKRHLWILTLGTLVSLPSLLISQFGFVSSSTRLYVLAPAMMLTPIIALLKLGLESFTRDFDLEGHVKLVKGWRPQAYPSVDVFLPTCGESLEVLKNTWVHVSRMQKHYPGVSTAYVLDDAARTEVRTMAAEFGFRYESRPNRGWFKKAGNLQFGLKMSRGEFVLILDADFCPRSDMLDETLCYFDADERLGILQTPQYFRIVKELTWLERGAAAVQELFYRAIQVARNQHDAVVCCGTNALYRRAALQENGGFALISHSEDVHTGLELRRLDWKVRYIPVSLASGMCPAEIGPFFSQQYRWCLGTMTIIGSRKFWSAKMGLAARLSDLSGVLYYVETALFTFLIPIIGLTLTLALPNQANARNYLLVVPSLLFAFVITPLWHRSSYGVETWAVKFVYGWAHFFAIWDTLRGREMGWDPTGSSGKRRGTGRLWAGIWLWSVTTAVAWVVLAGWRVLDFNTLAFTPIFLTAVFNLVIVLRVILSSLVEPANA